MILDFIPLLAQQQVEVILIGGVAAMVHGSARQTIDIDFVYRRTPENVRKLVAALADHQPYLRDAPPGLPFRWDEPTILSGLNFTLTTDLGHADFLGEVTGGGDYEQLLPFTEELAVQGWKIRCVSLEKLIQLKKAVGRTKDLLVVSELEILLEERSRQKPT